MTPTISQTINVLLGVIFFQSVICMVLLARVYALQITIRSFAQIDRLLKSGLKDRGELLKSKGVERP